jgi:hypothetical protein
MKINLLFTFLFCQVALFAQWTNQTAVNTEVAVSESSDMKSLGTVSGKTVVVFWKAVSAPTNYELRMQVLSSAGQKLLGPDGVLVSNNMSMSTSTAIMKIAVDVNENVYIGATGTNGGIGYAFKLNINGVHQWGTNGINLGGGYVVTILPLSTGEAVIAWNASSQTLMQKFSASGMPIWSSNQQVTNGATSNKSPADLFELSNNEYLLIFHVYSFGISSTLWAQKYSSAGLPIWANAIQLANKTTAWNTLYSSAQDGNVVYYGFKAATSTHFDSFLQRINPDGTLPWGINGKDFDTGILNNEMETKIAFSPGSSYVWSVCNYANGSQGAFGVYIQKFDKLTGARMFSDTAKMVYPIGSSRVSAGDLLLHNDQPIFLMKDGFDNGATPTTLNACYLNAQGNFVWSTQFVPMATYSASKSRIQFSKGAGANVVASFVETKANGLAKIYAHSVPLQTNNGSTYTTSACGSYTWINNVTYTSSTNTPQVVLTNVNGGDSTVTLNLTIVPTINDTLVVSTCGSYTWNGQTYTSSGIYQGATVNCHTNYLNLQLLSNSNDTLVVNSCGSYTWNGQTYTDSGIYQGPTSNCVTTYLELNITPPQTDTTYASSCGSYLWNGNSYNTTGVYQGATTNCVTSYLNLTINLMTTDTTYASSCDSYVWNGQTYSSTGIYEGPIQNCQMAILNLNIDPLEVVISVAGMTLTATSTAPNFQWINCENDTPIAGATSANFTPADPGNYAVVVSQGTCSDTSTCVTASDAAVLNLYTSTLTISPNPSKGIFELSATETINDSFYVYDPQGRVILEGKISGAITHIDLSTYSNGIYVLKLDAAASVYRLVKE